MSAHIIVPERYSRTDKRQAYREFWAEMYPYLVRAVEATFMDSEGKVRHVTQSEIKRRTLIAKKLVDTLRQELKWSKFRIRDHIATILKENLSGQIVIPTRFQTTRGSW